MTSTCHDRSHLLSSGREQLGGGDSRDSEAGMSFVGARGREASMMGRMGTGYWDGGRYSLPALALGPLGGKHRT